MAGKTKISSLQRTKKWGAIATVAAPIFFGIWAISNNECGGSVEIATPSGYKFSMIRENCKPPVIADKPDDLSTD